jgi:hypothetical protein
MQIDSVPARARFTGICVPRIQDRGKSAAEVVGWRRSLRGLRRLPPIAADCMQL